MVNVTVKFQLVGMQSHIVETMERTSLNAEEILEHKFPTALSGGLTCFFKCK